MNGYNFTERVRKVLGFARDEATALNHEYVGTEHLLLGLIREGEGVGASALKNIGVNLDDVRQTTHATVKPGKADALVRQDLPYTSRAKRCLELAMDETRRLNHDYVGTEHLCLGILREARGIAAQVLVDAGAKEDELRAEVNRLIGTPGDRGTSTSSSTLPPRSWPPELDAVVAAPAQHRVLLENPRVRVLDTLIAPGERTPVHTHQWSAVHYVISWSEFIRRDPDGNILLDTRGSKAADTNPYALWGDPLPPHSLENVGSTPLHIVSVEIKR